MLHVLICLDDFIWHNDLLYAMVNFATLNGWPYDGFELGQQSSLDSIMLEYEVCVRIPSHSWRENQPGYSRSIRPE